VKSSESGMFVFGLTKLRSKIISMPQVERDLPMEDLLERILQMRYIVEKSLGCDIRQYVFPEQILSAFM